MQIPHKNNSAYSLWNRILLTGLIAGTLDATAASIQVYLKTGKGPVIIFVYIASGVFGKEAFSMSQYIAFVGLLFHYLIAISFTAFYFLIYPKIKWLHWNKILNAVIYGIFVWFVMNRVVVPLSKAQSFPFDIQKALVAAGILIVCIGVPVSFIASSFFKNRLNKKDYD